MGNWNINIQGVGCHHNQNPEIDANLATVEFVKKLKAQGHHIEHATFTFGGSDVPVQDAAKDVKEDTSNG